MVQFARKSRGQDTSGFTISAMYNHTPVKGDVGIEIEVEGNKFKKEGIPKPWKYVKDGSLRGQDNAEYVLNGPIPFDKVPEATQTLWEMFTKTGSVLDDSNRTSVHVHMNVQQWHINRLASFLTAYYAVEEILCEFCGEHRVGNLFCLRGKDAPGILSRLRRFIRAGEAVSFTDGMHYGALNAQAIQKYGSVEIRTMRGAMDPSEVNLWVDILRRIYDLSAEYPDPRVLCDTFSGEGPMAFLEMILGEHTSTILNSITFDMQKVMESLYAGIHLSQDIAYCRDWSDFKSVDIKPDPFGRSLKSVAASLLAADAPNPAAEPGMLGVTYGELTNLYNQAAQLMPASWATVVTNTPSQPMPAPSIPAEFILDEEDDDYEPDYDDIFGEEEF